MREIDSLKRQARCHGEAVGQFAEELLDVQSPWTRMRRVYALLGLNQRYGDARVEAASRGAVAHQMFDLHHLEGMIRLNVKPNATPQISRVI